MSSTGGLNAKKRDVWSVKRDSENTTAFGSLIIILHTAVDTRA